MQEDSVNQQWFLSVENLWEVEVLNYPQKSKVHASSFLGQSKFRGDSLSLLQMALGGLLVEFSIHLVFSSAP